ncbi:DNA repair protein RecN [Pollutibacter soli]|uniref:DNA repair protein RecN n=1 Tax=Pollutibacter soli TaxID=3034157 RepID=UPI003013EB7A
MLSRLTIRNYAIIEEVDIQFSDNLNIITGETGAGKSILVGALGLVLGDRADSTVLADKNKKAVVEAVFSQLDFAEIDKLISEWDIDTADELLLRREINAGGKSRAFINDSPVNLAQLHQLAGMLVDLHQQFDTMELGSSTFQLNVLDALATHSSLRKEYAQFYNEYESLRKELAALKESQALANREADFHRFLFEELDNANFKDGEIEELDAELKLLSHAEQIKAVLGRVNFILQESEQPVVQSVRSAIQQLGAVVGFHQEIPQLSQRLQSAYIELQDIQSELENLNDKIQMDGARIDVLQQRIALAQKLFKKHNVSSTKELLAVKDLLEEKLLIIDQAGEKILSIEKQLTVVLVKAQKVADQLSAGRKRQVSPLEKKTKELLTRVGMPNAMLKVDIQPQELSQSGADKISFLFDANKTGRFEPLEKVASGGELSRLMLSLKSLVADSLQMPTLIFDEIDSGISGEAARQVGILMKELGQQHQVISITHQPQIAARANAHYYVYKKEKSGQIRTHIRRLGEDERIEAIARMLGGEPPSAVALENAREMVAG